MRVETAPSRERASRRGAAEATPARAAVAVNRMVLRENILMRVCRRECGGLLSKSFESKNSRRVDRRPPFRTNRVFITALPVEQT